MFDAEIPPAVRDTTPRIEIYDHVEMGRLVAHWALEPRSRPRDAQALRRQTSGVAAIPARIRSVAFVQDEADTLHLALPMRAVIAERMAECLDPYAPSHYHLPSFYWDNFRPGIAPVLTPLQMLFARMGDDPIAQGR